MELEKLFPVHIRKALPKDAWQNGLEEIRVRIGMPMEFCYEHEIRFLTVEEGKARFCGEEEKGRRETAYRTGMADIAEMMNYISNYSLYAYKEELKQGYITVEGGHRIGIAGGVFTERGEIAGISHITFLNIRIAHERKGCAGAIMPYIRYEGGIHNTLILSSPGAGKTTVLRDSIRMISEGDEGRAGMKVCVVDERSEIAACHMGIPQNDLGPRTDVLDGCGKAEGMLLLLRSMSPQVLAVDELGGEEDFAAVEQAVYSGSRVIGTVHAGEMRELCEKPYLRRWIEKEVFRRFILIQKSRAGVRTFQIYDEHMERLC